VTKLGDQEATGMEDSVKCRIRAGKEWTFHKRTDAIIHVVDLADVPELVVLIQSLTVLLRGVLEILNQTHLLHCHGPIVSGCLEETFLGNSISA
jgi:hypothetical protein